MPEITLPFDHAKNRGLGRVKFLRSGKSHNWKDEVHHRAVDPVPEQAYDIFTTEHLQ